MKKNEIKHLTTTTLLNNLTGKVEGTAVIERVKNSTYGTPRYEVIIITDNWTYKTRYEGYLGTSDIAVKSYNKIKKLLG